MAEIFVISALTAFWAWLVAKGQAPPERARNVRGRVLIDGG